MTLTYESDLGQLKRNHRVSYVGQR